MTYYKLTAYPNHQCINPYLTKECSKEVINNPLETAGFRKMQSQLVQDPLSRNGGFSSNLNPPSAVSAHSHLPMLDTHSSCTLRPARLDDTPLHPVCDTVL